MTEQNIILQPMDVVRFHYQNHRGEMAFRRVRIVQFRYGRTAFYNDHDQWFLEGWDMDGGEARVFAMERMSQVTHAE